jgi:hypothetical protein
LTDRLAGDDNLLEMLRSIPGQCTKIFIIFMFAPASLVFCVLLLLKSNKCTLLVTSTLNKIKVTIKSYKKKLLL